MKFAKESMWTIIYCCPPVTNEQIVEYDFWTSKSSSDTCCAAKSGRFISADIDEGCINFHTVFSTMAGVIGFRPKCTQRKRYLFRPVCWLSCGSDSKAKSIIDTVGFGSIATVLRRCICAIIECKYILLKALVPAMACNRMRSMILRTEWIELLLQIWMPKSYCSYWFWRPVYIFWILLDEGELVADFVTFSTRWFLQVLWFCRDDMFVILIAGWLLFFRFKPCEGIL